MPGVITRYPFLARSILASNYRRLDFPYKLTFALTYRCNGRCKTCNIWQKPPADELRAEEIKEFFSKNNQFAWIDLTGGEIFLREDLMEIVQTIVSECRHLCLLHFPTNGLLTQKIVSSAKAIVKKSPVKLIITVSVDGDEELNDTIRGVKGGWKRQMETFRSLRDIQGVKTVLGMTLSPYNYDKFEMTFQAARKECPWLNYKDFHVNIAHISGHYYDNEDLKVSEMPTDVVCNEIKRYMKFRGTSVTPVAFLEKEYLKRVESYLRSGKTPIRCHALRSSCFINPVGDVFPCGMYDKVVGSLKDHDYDLKKIWQSDECRKLQEEIWNFNCPQCWTPCEAYQSIFGSLLRRK